MDKIKIIGFLFMFLFISISLNSQPRMSLTDRVDQFTEDLNLSEEQQKDLTKILTTQREKMEDLRNASDGDRSAMGGEMDELFQDTNEQILSILDDDQKEKYNKILEEKKSRWQNRGNRNNGRMKTDN